MSDIQNKHMPKVTPQDDNQKEIFYNDLNKFIELQYVIDAAKEQQSEILKRLKEEYADKFDKSEQGEAKKHAGKTIKYMLDEFLKGKLTEDKEYLEAAEIEYNDVSKHLKG